MELPTPATNTKPRSKSTRSTPALARCQHLRADGKRCADAVYPGHATLCHYHLNQQMRGIAHGDVIAADLLHSIGNFQSAAAINVALGKIGKVPGAKKKSKARK
jgi:predicted SprT family Zn-dependent metalloprotease